jgi:hypothetical protein
MKFTNFAALIRYKTHTNTTTFTNTDILLLANTFKDDIAAEIAKCNEDYFGMEYLADLKVAQREYALPDDLLNNIKRVEAKLNGTDWKILNETDFNLESFTTEETAITEAFSGREPGFELFRRSLWILNDSAIIDVTAGLKLWCIIYPADFTDLTLATDMSIDPSNTSHGFPRQFHELLARRVIIDWKSNREKPIALTEHEQNYEYDLKKALDAIKEMNLDRTVIASTPSDDGSDF